MCVYDVCFLSSSLLVNKDDEIICYIRFCNLPIVSMYLKNSGNENKKHICQSYMQKWNFIL